MFVDLLNTVAMLSALVTTDGSAVDETQSSKIAFALDGFIAPPDVVTSNTLNTLGTFPGGHSTTGFACYV